MKTRTIINRLLAIQSFAISIIVSMLILATLSWPALAQTAVSGVPAPTATTGVPAGTPITPHLRNTFNHLKTGFPLRAGHLSVACETCHIGGTFKGTPRDCAGCHTAGQRIAATPKTQDHIPTTKACDACHSNGASFLTAVMDHTGLTEPCAVCHNGSYSTIIKSVPQDYLHIQNSTLPCDSCHKNTYTFLGSRFDHTKTTSDCASCHDNVQAPGKPAHHISTTLPCESCHTAAVTPGWPTPTSFKGVTTFDHTGNGNTIGSNTCSTCHDGSYTGVKAKSSAHIPTTLQCDRCHTTTISFAAPNWVMQHTANGNNTSGCATCHTGTSWDSSVVMGKPANHIPTTAPCETCHTDTTVPGGFKSWTMNHTGISTGCTNCHNGQTFQGAVPNPPTNKSSVTVGVHISTTLDCYLCHTPSSIVGWPSPTAGGFAGVTIVNHAGITLGCASCHTGATVGTTVVVGKPGYHITTSVACEICHINPLPPTGNIGGFATPNWTMNHTGIATGCATCHGQGVAIQNTPTLVTLDATQHVPVGSTSCESCHTAASTSTGGFLTGWTMGTAGHALVTANSCANCHDAGVTFTGVKTKPNNHIAYTAGTNCVVCHTSGNTGGYTTFLNATFDHAVAGIALPSYTCSTCHGVTTGVVAKPATHIPTNIDCGYCHTNYTTIPGGFASWTMDHADNGNTSGCANCHNGQTFQVTGTAPAPATMPSVSKPTTHIPTSAACELCHTNTTIPTGFRAWTMNHSGAGITSGCATCHALGKSFQNTSGTPLVTALSNHISIGNTACESCHSPAATSIGGFAAPNWTMNHAILPSLPPSPAIRCNSCHLSTLPAFQGSTTITNENSVINPHPVTISSDCGICHGSVTSFVTSTTYTHSPVPTGQCANCHNGTIALGKPAAHLVTAASCDTCHTNHVYTTGGFLMTVSHTVLGTNAVVGNHLCATSCHNDSANQLTKGATEPATHINVGLTSIPAVSCDSCHGNTTSFLGATMNHAGITTGCATCHVSTYAGVVIKPSYHIATILACEACHPSTSTATGGFAAPNWVMDHTANGNNLTGCATCHTGATLGATVVKGKPSNHIPTSATCETCHSTTSFTSPGGFGVPNPAMSHTGITTGCATCHNGANVGTTVSTISLGKPTTHIPTTSACELCHTTTTTPNGFQTWTMSHTGISSGCATCHASGKSFQNTSVTALVTLNTTNHVPVGSIACESCHNPALTTTGGFATATSGWTMGTTGHALVSATPCATCHADGVAFTGVVLKNSIIAHITTTAACDTCHTSTNTNGYTTFLGAVGAHAPGSLPVPTLGATCIGCHGGGTPGTVGIGGGKNMIVNHIPIGALDCSACHTYTTFVSPPVATTHTAVSGTACSTCHNTGSAYIGTSPSTVVVSKPTTHIPTTATCNSCHTGTTYASGTFNQWTMSHAGITSGCASCHGTVASTFTNNGGTPIVSISTLAHVPVGTVTCESCHSTTNFTVGGASGGFGTAWTMGATGHAAVVTTSCGTCHGTAASTYSGGSVPLKLIDGAHISSAFYPAQDCGTNCHTAGTTSNYSTGGFLLLNMLGNVPSHTGTGVAPYLCSNCHNNTIAKGTASFPTHIAVGASDCIGCHTQTNTSNYASFLGSLSGHTAASAPGQCATSGCHASGGAGKIFTTQHIPSSSPGATLTASGAGQCDGCHTTSYSTLSFTAYASANIHTASHWSTALKCSSCHNGTYTGEGAVGAQAKTLVNHIPTAITDSAGLDCNTCHYYTGTAPTISATGFAGKQSAVGEYMNHNGAKGGAPYYCVTCHLKGVTYLSGAQLVSHNGASTAKDCSSTSCHKPLGKDSNFGNYVR